MDNSLPIFPHDDTPTDLRQGFAARMSSLVQPLIGRNDVRAPRVIGGQGIWLHYEDGIAAIDAAAQDSSVILGHRHPELVAAIRDAADMAFASDTATGAPLRDATVAELLETAFDDAPFVQSVRFTCTGSEAIDLALHLAQTLTGRRAIAARRDSYHGAVGLSRDATCFAILGGGLSHPSGGFTKGTVSSEIRVFSPDMPENADDLVSLFAGCAAVITDCGSGHIYPSDTWFETIGAAASRAGALWIHDETVTGYGRTGGGKWFQSLEFDHKPDMIVAGKCVTGGAAPGSILFLCDRTVSLMDGRRWALGSTFWGHPLTLAAMRRVLEIVRRDDLVAEVAVKGVQLGDRLEELVRLHPNIVHSIGGTGFNRTIRLVASDEDRRYLGDGTYMPVASRASDAARLQGVSTPAYGPTGLWIVPPFIMTAAEIDDLAERLDKAFRSMSPP